MLGATAASGGSASGHGRAAGAEAAGRLRSPLRPALGQQGVAIDEAGRRGDLRHARLLVRRRVGWRVTSVVVAPGDACTTVGATGRVRPPEDSDGLGTMLRLTPASGGGLSAGLRCLGLRAALLRVASA